jgi:hypothetical protein
MKTAIIFFLLSFTACKSFAPTKAINFKSAIQLQINDLIEQGYSVKWASKIVLVENKIIEEDSEYLTIIED